MDADRGQSAVEYMMTYGWGILVVLIAGIVMWQMGFLNPGGTITPDKRGFSQVTPMDWSMSQAGLLTVVLQNNAGAIVNINGAAAQVVMGGKDDRSCDAPTPSTQTGFRPGARMTLTFSNCKLSDGLKMGEYYRINMTIDYQNPSSMLEHKSNGIIWGPLG
jgi:hypothetical protein